MRHRGRLIAAGLFMLALLPSCGPNKEQEAPIPAETAGVPTEDAPATIDPSTREALEAIGYMSGYEERTKDAGTTRYDATLAQPGYNLYISGHAPVAFLVDMEGKVLHQWAYDSRAFYDIVPSHDYWRRVHLADNGDLYALVDGHGIIKLNKNSELLWHTDGVDLLHHDLFVEPSGRVYAIGRNIAPIKEIHPETNVLDDAVVVFDEHGRRIDKFSIYDAFRGTEWAAKVEEKVKQVLAFADPKMLTPFEAFHTNTIEVFDGSLAGVSPLLDKGHLVLCSPIHQNVFIVDIAQKKVVWNWYGPWAGGIHQPTFLPNGNWLLFDNAALVNDQSKQSAVFEYTFPGKEQVWEYRGAGEKETFYSRFSSLAARLPNGNTLIVVSNEGRALEVTPDKKVAWEYYNPNSVANDMRGQKGFAARGDGEIIGTLFQLERIPAEACDRWLPKAAP